jgi:dynein intermediate chain 2
MSFKSLTILFSILFHRQEKVLSSPIETSHHDPVYDVFWVQSKTNTHAVSCSTDGQLLWWDIRHLDAPFESLRLDDGTGQLLGGSCLAYNMEAGPTR